MVDEERKTANLSHQVFPTPGEVSMHEYLLAGWGMPIGRSPISTLRHSENASFDLDEVKEIKC